ncbi:MULTISPECIES: SH3 domain-containing protein [unclassified Streptomyces]|uniref:SH3 domain-containing protein n=1 Tax=unclassified Streptomyces TaxID=2593676 RepID=UPI00324515F8
MKSMRRCLTTGLSLLFLGAGIGFAPAAVADVNTAATCTHPSWSNKDAGVDHVRYELLEGAPVRTGPNEGCGVVGRPDWNFDVYLHCYTVNSAGNTWSHVRAYNRFDGREYSGWIYDRNLDEFGSTKPC